MKRLVLLLLFGFWKAASAQDFVSVGDKPAVLYDAPSLKANKLFILGPHYPLEETVVLKHWVKVRDSKGRLFWIEKPFLGQNRYLMVTAPVADVRQAASDDAPLAFQATTGVLLQVTAAPLNGWIAVTHQDGQSGFVKASQVWGG
ncbi:MAG TPA: SH3 domain-containing protein [Burkholderiales bacterium]|nr:SH3 domain-containing protein [Burkholderiales bacterium]